MDVLILVPVLLFSFVIHEWAHAWVADREGDPTPRQMGRLTLNPIPHIDLFGTLIVPAMLVGSGSGFLIGWAKPVQVVPSNFRHFRRGDILVSLAGVMSNFVLGIACTLALIGLVYLTRAVPSIAVAGPTLERMLETGIRLNFVLAVFNLLPIPPLDGSRLIYHLLPRSMAEQYRRLERWGVLVFVLLLLSGAITYLLIPADLLSDMSMALIEWST
ncbi:MAG: site-2 protease family protein [Longimicrobiales bacterium]